MSMTRVNRLGVAVVVVGILAVMAQTAVLTLAVLGKPVPVWLALL